MTHPIGEDRKTMTGPPIGSISASERRPDEKAEMASMGQSSTCSIGLVMAYEDP